MLISSWFGWWSCFSVDFKPGCSRVVDSSMAESRRHGAVPQLGKNCSWFLVIRGFFCLVVFDVEPLLLRWSYGVVVVDKINEWDWICEKRSLFSIILQNSYVDVHDELTRHAVDFLLVFLWSISLLVLVSNLLLLYLLKNLWVCFRVLIFSFSWSWLPVKRVNLRSTWLMPFIIVEFYPLFAMGSA